MSRIYARIDYSYHHSLALALAVGSSDVEETELPL